MEGSEQRSREIREDSRIGYVEGGGAADSKFKIQDSRFNLESGIRNLEFAKGANPAPHHGTGDVLKIQRTSPPANVLRDSPRCIEDYGLRLGGKAKTRKEVGDGSRGHLSKELN